MWHRTKTLLVLWKDITYVQKASTFLNEGIFKSLFTKAAGAACCTSFFGFLCCAEFVYPDNTYFNSKVHLSISNSEYVHSDIQLYISLQIKASKTDQFWQGTMVKLGATKTEVCLVAAILGYLGTCGNTWSVVYQQWWVSTLHEGNLCTVYSVHLPRLALMEAV